MPWSSAFAWGAQAHQRRKASSQIAKVTMEKQPSPRIGFRARVVTLENMILPLENWPRGLRVLLNRTAA